MSGFKNIKLDSESASIDAGSRLRVSEMITLTDLKTLNEDKNLRLENVATVLANSYFSNNTYIMNCASNEYSIRSSKRFLPYFSGKSQMIECTFQNFHTEIGATKRIGYFSSNAIVPYDLSYDGFWLENDGTTIRLRASNSGTTTINIPITSWSNYSEISSYDWSKFTVIMFDYLWLGGTALRLFIMINGEFVLAHKENWAGQNTGTFIKSPNQKIRYELRTSLGSIGTMTYICSQISTEGQSILSYNSQFRAVHSGYTGITFSTIGRTYPLKSIKIKNTQRDESIRLSNIKLLMSSTSDIALYSIHLNPILSAPLAYTNVLNSAIQEATGNGIIFVSTNGTILETGYITTNIMPMLNIENNILALLGSTLNNTFDELVLCITPITSNVTVFGSIHYQEF